MVIEFTQQISIYCTNTAQNTPANGDLQRELNKHLMFSNLSFILNLIF